MDARKRPAHEVAPSGSSRRPAKRRTQDDTRRHLAAVQQALGRPDVQAFLWTAAAVVTGAVGGHLLVVEEMQAPEVERANAAVPSIAGACVADDLYADDSLTVHMLPPHLLVQHSRDQERIRDAVAAWLAAAAGMDASMYGTRLLFTALYARLCVLAPKCGGQWPHGVLFPVLASMTGAAGLPRLQDAEGGVALSDLVSVVQWAPR